MIVTQVDKITHAVLQTLYDCYASRQDHTHSATDTIRLLRKFIRLHTQFYKHYDYYASRHGHTRSAIGDWHLSLEIITAFQDSCQTFGVFMDTCYSRFFKLCLMMTCVELCVLKPVSVSD